jgi:pyruvate/2-oxoglutarate dehydrogenase complex dihydrolipoamide dehydrogenase (E3) component
MTGLSTDVVVVGLGPGGQAVAEELARAGVPVVGIDAGLVGGECPYWGCVPSKRMARAAAAIGEARRIGEDLAGSAAVTPDWAPVHAWIADQATDHWDDTVAVERLEGLGGTFVRGRGRLTGPRTVEVDGPEGTTTVTARRAVVVATGSAPAVPPIDGLAGTPYWTNHEFIESPVLPASVVVLGGGAVGCELAQAMARFGVAVTLVEPAPRLLALEEPAAGALLAEVFGREGIAVRTGVGATAVQHADGAFTVALADGSEVSCEKLLVATGRRVNLGAVGLDSIGVDTSARSVAVDDRLRVVADGAPVDGVYAIGDVTGKGAFTHVAVHQARVVVEALRDGVPASNPITALPRVTFTDPEIGAVGLTEAQARERGLEVRVATATLAGAATRGWIHGPGNDGFITVVASEGRLVGATSAGPTGGEVLGALSVAVQAGIPVAELRRQIWAYPTMHRGIEYVLSLLDAD